jgi:glycoside/pentoside/hexuronide:cation symporter, GPH family
VAGANLVGARTKGLVDMRTQQHTTAAEDRVPWSQLIAYGLGGLVPVALFNIAGQLMGLLGNISLGRSAVLLGAILIAPKLWDALSDPVVGYLSDTARTRWGRRRPFILVGGIATAASFVAMWWVPRGAWIHELLPSEAAYNWFQLLYILVGVMLFFTACTVFEIPHGALGMEMSADYHERTRLFSAKSFLGNLFAMGTPWLIFLSGLQYFRGTGGDLVDGMRWVSMLIAAALVPLAIWWFLVLKEPPQVALEQRRKSNFLNDIGATIDNKTFLNLVAIIFTLAMGFNFVNIFSYYIAIFYLYGGDAVAAGSLLGWNGTAWAVTGLVAVFPLNWLSRRIGKNSTLIVAIMLMCAAQLSKILCYNPDLPYLVLIPTVLLSAGMLMFFTLGSSMVADVCDEDELKTGRRSEGVYYSVNWWFIKMGTAFASIVTGFLLLYTRFDETQNVLVDAVQSDVAVIRAEAESWLAKEAGELQVSDKLGKALDRLPSSIDKLESHLNAKSSEQPDKVSQLERFIDPLKALRRQFAALGIASGTESPNPAALLRSADEMLKQIVPLKRQSPTTLFRLRAVEIGVPLLLSVISLLLTFRYPLTEARCYEIKEELKKRHAGAPT